MSKSNTTAVDAFLAGVLASDTLEELATHLASRAPDEARVQLGNAFSRLAEYRNGGLMLDAGLLQPRDAALPRRVLAVGDEPVVEWRALTVGLLDRIADAIRRRLGRDASTLPLASVLEGGTWAAGRRLAREKRADGAPPLSIESDGTVF